MTIYLVNSITCAAKQDLNFNIRELECKFRGKGVYQLEKPNYLKKLIFDRFSKYSWLYISDEFTVEEVVIEKGPHYICTHVLIDGNVERISVNGQLCQSSVTVSMVSLLYLQHVNYIQNIAVILWWWVGGSIETVFTHHKRHFSGTVLTIFFMFIQLVLVLIHLYEI